MKKSKKKEIFLSIAGFLIKISLLPTEQLFYRKKIEEYINEVWGNGGFLTKKRKKTDFEVVIKDSETPVKIIPKEKGKMHYYPAFERDFKGRKVKTHYFISMAFLSMVLKEVVIFLLSQKGFLVHGSAVMDKKGVFYVFMAKSKGGKTTVSDLISKGQGFEKVADDALIVKKVKDEWVFYGSPFVEKEHLPASSWTKKAKIFFVKKGKKAKVKPFEKDPLKPLLEQLRLRYDEVDKATLKVAMEFSKENEFFELTSSLKRKEILEEMK